MKFYTIEVNTLNISENLEIPGFELKGKQQHKFYNSQDHRRKVWKDPRTNHYYKIWYDSYYRGEYFYNALKAGFYGEDLVPAFLAVIVEGNCCRGYVTKSVKTLQ